MLNPILKLLLELRKFKSRAIFKLVLHILRLLFWLERIGMRNGVGLAGLGFGQP